MTSSIYNACFVSVICLGHSETGQAKYLTLLCLLGEGFYLLCGLLLGQMFIKFMR